MLACRLKVGSKWSRDEFGKLYRYLEPLLRSAVSVPIRQTLSQVWIVAPAMHKRSTTALTQYSRAYFELSPEHVSGEAVDSASCRAPGLAAAPLCSCEVEATRRLAAAAEGAEARAGAQGELLPRRRGTRVGAERMLRASAGAKT
eukprot:972005-Pleurochrysis_carterae.AAC.3